MRHKTEDCFTLKDAIEEAVQNGKLVEFINWRGTNNKWMQSSTKRRAYMSGVMSFSTSKKLRHQEQWSLEFRSGDDELICNE
ncbi:hypothetical protein J1N35_018980 [Gossypium stocksii]|uniref:Uncharacterized protein n=1 Tax=Gossypium stocksii TaxID=47602 RepID=A0A9D3VRR2_9ROSI|nr:hypothetical protein J1N35_018980 [Gossypium stocksii]